MIAQVSCKSSKKKVNHKIIAGVLKLWKPENFHSNKFSIAMKQNFDEYNVSCYGVSWRQKFILEYSLEKEFD